MTFFSILSWNAFGSGWFWSLFIIQMLPHWFYIFGIPVRLLKTANVEVLEPYILLRLSRRNYLSDKIKLVSPQTIVFGNDVERVNNTLLIASPDIPGDLALMKLDINSFSVSSGSACSSGKISQSHVLKAMGYDSLASNSIRLSFPPNDIILASDNLITTKELDRLAQCWSNI